MVQGATLATLLNQLPRYTGLYWSNAARQNQKSLAGPGGHVHILLQRRLIDAVRGREHVPRPNQCASAARQEQDAYRREGELLRSAQAASQRPLNRLPASATCLPSSPYIACMPVSGTSYSLSWLSSKSTRCSFRLPQPGLPCGRLALRTAPAPTNPRGTRKEEACC